MIGLFVRQGPGDGAFIPLEPERGRHTIGRSPDATIRLDAEGVSRRHAQLEFLGDRWILRDLGSRNGTYLNSLPVREKPLRPRDVIVMGRAELLVVAHDTGMDAAGPGDVPDRSGTVLLPPFAAPGLAGESAAIRGVIDLLLRVAPLHITVLLRGETGTGKELAARALHSAGGRRDGPFVAVNCGALPETLLESELFGYEKGAFTGAAATRAGRFEEAGQGTLFLDEIGDLPGPAQAKLLRVLQDGVVRRLGGTEDIRVDARIVAATHRDLEGEIRAGRFRQDLYHRFNVVEIRLPPLRERKADIPLLARRFLDELAATSRAASPALTEDALTALLTHRWPGNVRELRNAVERAAMLANGRAIESAHLEFSDLAASGAGPASPASGPADPSTAGGDGSLPEQMARTEESIIRSALAAAGWNRSLAARRLGISEGKMRKCIRQYGIRRP